MTDIKSLTPEELSVKIKNLGEPGFRAGQIISWLHRGVTAFDEMTDLPLKLRGKLAAEFYIPVPVVLRRQESEKDGTVKLLWGLNDSESVESVVMEYKHGNSVCISTQVGCKMGCMFCASALNGFVRNLEPSEMLDQVIFSGIETKRRISNIVLMGIGEPLDNLDNVLRFLTLVSMPGGLNVGMRHISLSTCGIAEKVDKLGSYNLQLTLSVSLHAPDNETRSRIMPVNNTYCVEELIASCRGYFAATGRRVSFEYALIDAVNDSAEHAEKLAGLLRGSPWHVNLILLNDVPERGLKASSKENAARFSAILNKHGINCTFRRRLGSDIDAACGQLRRRER